MFGTDKGTLETGSGRLNGKDLKIGIVQARFNEPITDLRHIAGHQNERSPFIEHCATSNKRSKRPSAWLILEYMLKVGITGPNLDHPGAEAPK